MILTIRNTLKQVSTIQHTSLSLITDEIPLVWNSAFVPPSLQMTNVLMTNDFFLSNFQSAAAISFKVLFSVSQMQKFHLHCSATTPTQAPNTRESV